MRGEIDVHFNRLAVSGWTLVVVAVGTEAYGAADWEPLTALHCVARRAAEDSRPPRLPC